MSEMKDFDYVINEGFPTETRYTYREYNEEDSPKLIVPVASLEGIKYDNDKPRTDLLPTVALEGVASVLGYGAKKYDTWNWAKGMAYGRLIGAALRHLFAFARGEDNDKETGLSHLDHAACCILFLSTYVKTKRGTDDRFKF